MTPPDDDTTPLESRLAIETPERVEIVYDLAGIGSRFSAGLLDFSILLFVFVIVACGIGAFRAGPLGRSTENLGREELFTVGIAASGLLAALVWAYYIGFELFWGGRTPGKHILRLRVVSEHGGPAPAWAIFVRNIVRLADAFPFAVPYALGGVVMFVNRRSKRLGDLLSGTVVVRERPHGLEPGRLRLPGEKETDAVEGALSDVDAELVRSFLDRRGELRPQPRKELARSVVDSLSARHEFPPGDDERILRLLHQGYTPAQIRDAAGPAARPPAEGGP